MTNVSIDIDQAQIKALKKKLGSMKSKAPVVLCRAINSAASSTRAKMGQETAKRYNIGSRKVQKTVFVTNASKSSLKATVTSRGKPLELKEYSFKMGNPPKAAVKKGGQKPLDGDPKAFIATMRGPRGGSHTDAYQRHELSSEKAAIRSTRKEGKENKMNKHNVNIHKFHGPAIPSIIKNEDTMSAIEKNAMERLEKRIDKEVNNILQGGK